MDTLGNLLRVWVHPADLADREAAWWWLDVVCTAVPTLQTIFADQGYTGAVVQWAKEHCHLALQVVTKAPTQVGFVLLPRRWVVERTFAWLGRNRRLAKDYEHLTDCSETWVYLASIRRFLSRLQPLPKIS